MPRLRWLVWPHLTYLLIGLLVLAGLLIFLWYLLTELTPSAGSRWALGLQVSAVGLAALLARWRPPPRLILYPALLAAVIYLWDHTLPPISLPEGPARWLVPRLALVGGLADLALVLRQRLLARDLPRRLNGQARAGVRRLPAAEASPGAGALTPGGPYVSGFNDGYQGQPAAPRAPAAYRQGWQAGRQLYREQHGRDPVRPAGGLRWPILLLFPLCAIGLVLLPAAVLAAGQLVQRLVLLGGAP